MAEEQVSADGLPPFESLNNDIPVFQGRLDEIPLFQGRTCSPSELQNHASILKREGRKVAHFERRIVEFELQLTSFIERLRRELQSGIISNQQFDEVMSLVTRKLTIHLPNYEGSALVQRQSIADDLRALAINLSLLNIDPGSRCG